VCVWEEGVCVCGGGGAQKVSSPAARAANIGPRRGGRACVYAGKWGWVGGPGVGEEVGIAVAYIITSM